MYNIIDTDAPVSRIVKNIIKKYASRAVVIGFTALKQVTGKKVFAKTRFCKCMKGNIILY